VHSSSLKTKWAAKTKKALEKLEKKKAQATPLDGQVVELPPTLNEQEPPENARYLAESNHRTLKESRSRDQDSSAKNASHERSRRAAPSPKNTLSKQKSNENKEKAEADTAKAATPYARLALPTLKKRHRIKLKLDQDIGIFQNQTQSDALKGRGQDTMLNLGQAHGQDRAGAQSEQSAQHIDLIPKMGVLAQIFGAPMNDHLEDVEEGHGTFLNTREFKYASFFNRLKRGVSQYWEPFPEYRRRDPTGHVYGKKNRMTVLQITLNADGSLKQAQVYKSSGLKFLDREAISAFKRAQPFPNPPTGLMNPQGQIEFPFGFNIDFSQRQGMRLPF
jgi:TonB family protein